MQRILQEIRLSRPGDGDGGHGLTGSFGVHLRQQASSGIVTVSSV
jgi:hypothetical protein